MNIKVSKILFFIILLSLSADIRAQDNSLTLKQCYDLVYKNFPEAKQNLLFQSAEILKLKNLNVNYLPQITLKGQATYQSDVTNILISTPLFKPPEPPKDRYLLSLDVMQVIYDGGTTSSLKEVESAQTLIDKQKVEVNLFALRQKINDLYFSVLLLQEKLKILETAKADIESRILEIESKIRNEVVTPSALYSLQAQLLQIEQDMESVNLDKSSSVKMLGELIGKNIHKNTKFELPEGNIIEFNDNSSNRPEYVLFEFQKHQISAYDEVTSSKIIPRLSAFGQTGYGKPGLNMLDNSYKPFYMIGLNFSWNPVNWGSNSNEKELNIIRRKILDTQKETFDKNLKVSLEKYKSEIAKYEELIAKDSIVLSLREKIVSSIYSQFVNGTVTSTIYITELNNKTQSELLMQTHKIQLLQSKINYLTAKGDF